MAQVARCWARVLDDCDGGISGEHRVSIAAWPDGQGRDEKKRKIIALRKGTLDARGNINANVPGGFIRPTISVNRITEPVLCRYHNEALSDTDKESGRLSTNLREFWTTWKEKRSIPGLTYAPKVLEVDGPLMERWFLKSAITNFVSMGLPIGSPDAAPGMPSDELVEIAFDRRTPTGPIGLYGVGIPNEVADERDEFEFGAYHHPDPTRQRPEYIAGAFCGFRGIRALVHLTSTISAPTELGRAVPGWHGAKVFRPFEAVQAPVAGLSLRFRWPAQR